MNLRFNSPVKQAALLVFCLSLAIRVLIPVGYMPAAIGDGWPVRLCHNGLPHGFLAAHDEHLGLDGEDDDTLWQYCPFGVWSAGSGFGYEFQVDIADFAQDLRPAVPATPAPAATAAIFRSRAPPRIQALT